MLRQMNNRNERWSLFYQIFEISSQLARYTILILETTNFFSSRFQCQGILNELLVVPLFVSYAIYLHTLVSFIVFHSFVDIYICLVSQLNSDLLIGTIYGLFLHSLTSIKNGTRNIQLQVLQILIFYSLDKKNEDISLHDFSVTIPRCQKDVYVNSFFPGTAKLWNSMSIECFASFTVGRQLVVYDCMTPLQLLIKTKL